MKNENAKYWLEPVLDKIEAAYPEGEIVISSGISPSANYHIGHYPEILSADMIMNGLKQRGRDSRHVHVVDNMDPLRRRYDFLPEEYEQYVGQPICLIPSPYGEGTYGDYFFNEFFKYVEMMKLDVEVVRSYEDLYRTGRMVPQIEAVMENIEVIHKIFKDMSNRKLEADWAPVQVMGEDGKFFNGRVSTWDKEAKTIEGISYVDGKAKLNWRLDWPARWQVLGVNVEPHSWQEHGAAGGSFETGHAFSDKVFNNRPPMAGIQYGNVHLKGDNFKMSSSKGNLITPAQAFKIMPPVVLRYFYARYLGKKRMDFDPSLGIFRMLDEFSKVDSDIRSGIDNEFAPAYKIATFGQDAQAMSSVPFSHLVSVYQAALGDPEKVLQALKRTEYAGIVDAQKDLILGELTYVKNWLADWAPEDVKFEVQDHLPQTDLTQAQKDFLNGLADEIESADSVKEGQFYHDLIYAQKDKYNLEPQQAFKAIYQVILGKDFGPKAGWFLSILEPEWLVNRFRLVD
jgi:lysyl-tRNA synthetase class 1